MKRERSLPTVLTHQEINAIIATMYSSGLRVSEVIHLHYDDISRTNMTIHVQETKGRTRIALLSVITVSKV